MVYDANIVSQLFSSLYSDVAKTATVNSPSVPSYADAASKPCGSTESSKGNSGQQRSEKSSNRNVNNNRHFNDDHWRKQNSGRSHVCGEQRGGEQRGGEQRDCDRDRERVYE